MKAKQTRAMNRIFKIIFLCSVLLGSSCASDKASTDTTSTIERDGSELEKAILVSNAEEQERWISEHYPESKITERKKSQKNGKRYEKVSVQLDDGAQTDVFFDISNFNKK
jgi:hypothetical protein